MKVIFLSIFFSTVSWTLLCADVLGDWTFEDSPGFLIDSSIAGRDLTLEVAGVTHSVLAGPDLGKSADFAGGGYLSRADEAVWTDSTMTAEVYFNVSAASGGTEVLVGHWNGSINQRSWVIGINNSKIRILQSDDGSSSTTTDVLSVTSGKNYYLAVIFNGGGGTAYLKNLSDDEDFTSTNLSGLKTSLFDSNQALTVGSTHQPSSQFTGSIGRIRISDGALDRESLLLVPPEPVEDVKFDGYKGLWFNLGQYGSDGYGPKYSGGLATYTAKHRPVAVYSAIANKTFFTYGGTTSATATNLRIMASEYDHSSHTVPKPTMVMSKGSVNDPHDNAAIQIDRDGYVYVFVSGRNTTRKGFIYRSTEPNSTNAFTLISDAAGLSFTYPQIWYLPGTEAAGDEIFFHFFTRYTAGRELYFAANPDPALTTANATKLASLGGQYQSSNRSGNTVGTAFNRHPGGNVDARTDLYYLQTSDDGETWQYLDGSTGQVTTLSLPVTSSASPARVIDYSAQDLLVYMKDLVFDADGNPVILYVTANDANGNGYRPGPVGEPRLMRITRWTGSNWVTTSMPPSATAVSTVIHNYCTGSIHIADDVWTVVAPTGAPAAPGEGATTAEIERYWGQGGEMETWRSTDQGVTWTKVKTLTRESPRKHGYARIPQDTSDPFFAFWADGNPEAKTEVHLYFGNGDGTQYWELPYDMTTDTATPVEGKGAYLRWLERHADPEEISADVELEATDDPDEDQVDNEAEFYFGTDPFDAVDLPELRLRFDGTAGILSYSFNPEATGKTISVLESEAPGTGYGQALDFSERLRNSIKEGLDYIEIEDEDLLTESLFQKFYRLQLQ